jgi:hypothetical protein
MSEAESKPAAPKPKLRWYQYRLRTLLLLPVVIALWFALVPRDLTLYVSNQSSACDPIDIHIEIDGQLVADDTLNFGHGHAWKTFTLSLRPGWHTIVARSAKGEAVFQADFAMFWSRWAELDYWCAPGDPRFGQRPTAKHFSFDIQSHRLYHL